MNGRPFQFAALSLLLLATLATASPVINDPSTAAVFVQNNATPTSGDRFAFGSGSANTVGTIINLISPNGQSMSFTQTSGSPTASTAREIFGLDGTRQSGPNTWTATGSLIGAAVDGTWRIDIIPTGPYTSDQRIGPNNMIVGDVSSLILGGKQVNYGANYDNSATLMQYWNWHITVAGNPWSEPSTAPDPIFITISPSLIDPPCEGADAQGDPGAECPADFRFFQSTTGQSSPLGATGQSAITCGAPPQSFTMTGAWKRGATQSANTFVRFAIVPGNLAPTVGDLRTQSTVSFTTLTDVGAGSSGTHTSAGATYNNAAGHIYQLLTRSGSTGAETFSNPVYVARGECAITGSVIAGLFHDENEFQLQASQAQCSIDRVSFEITLFALGSGSGLGAMTVVVYDAITGTPVLAISKTEMTTVGTFAFQVFGFAKLFPPGAYFAIATADITGGIGVSDYYDATPFNVPIGNCNDSATNLAPILTKVAELNANLTRHDLNQTTFHGNLTSFLGHINAHLHIIDANITASKLEILQAINDLNVTIIGNVTGNFSIDNATLSNIYSILIEKLGPPGEPMEIAHTLLFFWIIALLVMLRHRKLLAAGACTLGVAISAFVDWGNLDPVWHAAAFGVLGVALWLEATGRDQIIQEWISPPSSTRRES